jgi:hypothetical protein
VIRARTCKAKNVILPDGEDDEGGHEYSSDIGNSIRRVNIGVHRPGGLRVIPYERSDQVAVWDGTVHRSKVHPLQSRLESKLNR